MLIQMRLRFGRTNLINMHLRLQICPHNINEIRKIISEIFFIFLYNYIFWGIPFAAAPVKSLRFMPPVTVAPWKEVLNADEFSPVCPQVSV